MIAARRLAGLVAAAILTLLPLADPLPSSAAVSEKRFGEARIVPPVLVGPLDAYPRWADVALDIETQLQDRPPALAAARDVAERYQGKPARRLVRAISHFVTRNVHYQEDRPHDRWAGPAETMASARGDCEDQAILGLFMALAAGVPPERAAVAIGRDRRGNQHAVLLIEDAGGRLALFDIAEPGSPSLTRSGFVPEMLGFLTSVGFPRR